MSDRLSVIVPTKDRAVELVRAVSSIIEQTQPAYELCIIDQGGTNEAKIGVQQLFEESRQVPKLVYVHDPGIHGLVSAKAEGVRVSTGDIVCFLEDDVVLEPSYLAQVAEAFSGTPSMLGCGGVITNEPRSRWLHVRVRPWFFRGIFRDPRIQVFDRARDAGHGLSPCDVLSGGVSSWRREVFETVPFDTKTGFHFLEDMEFATRVVRRHGSRLYVNAAARLAHYPSAANRDSTVVRQRRKVSEAVRYYKTRREWPGATRGILLALVWWFGEAAMQSIRLRSLSTMRSFLDGVREGAASPIPVPDSDMDRATPQGSGSMSSRPAASAASAVNGRTERGVS